VLIWEFFCFSGLHVLIAPWQLGAIRARAPAPVCPRPALRPARHASGAGAGASAETAVAPAHAPRPVAVPSFSEKEVQLFSKNRLAPPLVHFALACIDVWSPQEGEQHPPWHGPGPRGVSFRDQDRGSHQPLPFTVVLVVFSFFILFFAPAGCLAFEFVERRCRSTGTSCWPRTLPATTPLLSSLTGSVLYLHFCSVMGCLPDLGWSTTTWLSLSCSRTCGQSSCPRGPRP
jgi:hypothetical protein